MAGWADVTRFAHDNTHHVTVRKSCYAATRRSAKGSPMSSGGKKEGRAGGIVQAAICWIAQATENRRQVTSRLTGCEEKFFLVQETGE